MQQHCQSHSQSTRLGCNFIGVNRPDTRGGGCSLSWQVLSQSVTYWRHSEDIKLTHVVAPSTLVHYHPSTARETKATHSHTNLTRVCRGMHCAENKWSVLQSCGDVYRAWLPQKSFNMKWVKYLCFLELCSCKLSARSFGDKSYLVELEFFQNIPSLISIWDELTILMLWVMLIRKELLCYTQAGP